MKPSIQSPAPRHRRLASSASALFMLAALQSAPAALAGDDSGSGVDYYSQLSCAQLWYERNAILARNGYCFKSERALATFGNTCRPPFGKLPGNLNRVVENIRGWERRRGCS